MPWTYDRSADAFYVYFGAHHPDSQVERQLEVTEGIFLDLGADGQALGVEILRPDDAPWELVLRHELVPLDAVRHLAFLSGQRWRPINFVKMPPADAGREAVSGNWASAPSRQRAP